ncbi:MAG: hypothetical protein US13_C0001G0007 [candidate division TM6 bacterium GW2011_GWE2_36_25]|nr:MAG: hypothetical protein US03_C0001G0197 [candidate division TM6 bacterium GW2011_GWF2_36_131]KKQ03667.1 MAG: hypothetical protein US13_C0001G0007 [candidate division TM6 bacterium GW2011_GWE2_36_25]KKQ18338.1 MAG: hypothetical protein US32_C0027G0005 [candidate division TM6 bacterium GW2011_GWA2_36_9]
MIKSESRYLNFFNGKIDFYRNIALTVVKDSDS